MTSFIINLRLIFYFHIFIILYNPHLQVKINLVIRVKIKNIKCMNFSSNSNRHGRVCTPELFIVLRQRYTIIIYLGSFPFRENTYPFLC